MVDPSAGTWLTWCIFYSFCFLWMGGLGQLVLSRQLVRLHSVLLCSLFHVVSRGVVVVVDRGVQRYGYSMCGGAVVWVGGGCRHLYLLGSDSGAELVGGFSHTYTNRCLD
ncbi:hypothetical protein AMECASPLE_030804 [Ameca splendens]|uniref:Uncharacterized protein n=1 Tax=Ameca splendens TaxID=208324 RepID=A0ABV0YT55_9TELE